MQNTLYCPKITLNCNLLFFIDRCDFNKAKCKVPDLEKIGLSDCKSTGVTRAFIEKFKRRRNRTKGSGKQLLVTYIIIAAYLIISQFT